MFIKENRKNICESAKSVKEKNLCKFNKKNPALQKHVVTSILISRCQALWLDNVGIKSTSGIKGLGQM